MITTSDLSVHGMGSNPAMSPVEHSDERLWRGRFVTPSSASHPNDNLPICPLNLVYPPLAGASFGFLKALFTGRPGERRSYLTARVVPRVPSESADITPVRARLRLNVYFTAPFKQWYRVAAEAGRAALIVTLGHLGERHLGSDGQPRGMATYLAGGAAGLISAPLVPAMEHALRLSARTVCLEMAPVGLWRGLMAGLAASAKQSAWKAAASSAATFALSSVFYATFRDLCGTEDE